MPRKFRKTATAAIVAAALVVTACSGTPETPDGSTEELSQLVVVRAIGVETLNADTVTSNRQGAETLVLIVESLYNRDSDGVPIPGVAESHVISDDQLTWTFTLRDGITFSNGEEVTSADVRFSLENAQAGPLQGNVYQGIGIETPDERTVVLTTEQPNSGLLNDLSRYSAAIIPENFAGMSEDEFWRAPVGTGQYVVDSWQPGVEIALVRNDAYWGTAPAIERLVFRPFTDANTRLLQLQNGTADVIEDPAYSQIATLESNADTELLEMPYPTSNFMTLNTRIAPFDDRNARRAVSLAINRDDVAAAALQGHGEAAGSFIARAGLGGFAPEFGVTFDREAALAELAKSSTPDGFAFDLIYNPETPEVAAAVQVVQAQLAEVGITVNLHGLNAEGQGARMADGDWGAIMAGIITEPDAGGVLQYYGATDGLYSGTALIPAVDAAWAESQLDFTQGGRLAIYQDILTQVAEEAVQIGLFSPPRLFGVRAGLEVDPRNHASALDYPNASIRQ